MKAIVLTGVLLASVLFPLMAEDVWLTVKRESKTEIAYKAGDRNLRSLDDVASYLRAERKKLSAFPAVRVIFDPSCTFNDFSNLRGWLEKLGVLDDKYYLTDSGHRAISEFGMIGGQLAYPSPTAAASSDVRQPSSDADAPH